VHRPQHRYSFPVATVSHFIRRKAFCKKFFRLLQSPLGTLRIARIEQVLRYRRMVHGSYFQHANAFSNGFASNLIPAAQGALAGIEKKSFQRRRVCHLQRGFRSYLNVFQLYHRQFPKYRATSTSASSVVLPWRARMSSAAFCGFWLCASVRLKLLSTPSVAKTTVSPGLTGKTAACNGGNCAPTTPARNNKDSST